MGDEYIGNSKEQKSVHVGLQLDENNPSKLQYSEGLARIQLISKGGNRSIGVGQDTLSIHMYPPYHDTTNYKKGGWEEFEQRIKLALEKYTILTNRNKINRIGIRYINIITIPAEDARVENYLKCAHLEIEGLPQDYSNFINRTDYIYDESHTLVLRYGSIENFNCLLDLDVVWKQDNQPVEWQRSLEIAGDLHQRSWVAFEALVTDKARELFNAE